MKRFLKSETYLLLVIALAMLNNFEHSAVVYHDISRNIFPSETANWLLSFAVVLIIDLSIFAFVIRGQHVTAGIYAGMIFIVNLLYYHGLGLFSQAVNDRIAAVTFSSMFVYSIYEFSRLYAKESKQNELQEAKQKAKQEKQATSSNFEQQSATGSNELQLASNKVQRTSNKQQLASNREQRTSNKLQQESNEQQQRATDQQLKAIISNAGPAEKLASSSNETQRNATSSNKPAIFSNIAYCPDCFTKLKSSKIQALNGHRSKCNPLPEQEKQARRKELEQAGEKINGHIVSNLNSHQYE